MAVVQQPIQDRRGHDASPNTPPHSPPSGCSSPASSRARSDGYELEEQVRGIGLERQIAQLVDHQQLGLGEVDQLLLEPSLDVRSVNRVTRPVAGMNSVL